MFRFFLPDYGLHFLVFNAGGIARLSGTADGATPFFIVVSMLPNRPFDNQWPQCVSKYKTQTVTSQEDVGASQVVTAIDSRQIAMISAASATHSSSFIGFAR